jgi:hypothetical protein
MRGIHLHDVAAVYNLQVSRFVSSFFFFFFSFALS